MATIWTCGHSNKGGDEFAALVVSAEVGTIVDVRSVPYSRHNPQFNRETLAATLEAAEVYYEWRGENLGGIRRNVDYAETIRELVARAERGERIAVMCSEGSSARCHRGSTLTPSFLQAGADVAHIEWSGKIVLVEHAAYKLF
ncbi:hypothetical protein SEA_VALENTINIPUFF_112 [Microbacterium phage ValentiniPuff]|uniref:DUF488 domain-containing protein n=1 Tax=Microbacterium phage ValentiniPuff TaxID=2315705 RepID=A0A386KP92_9CAUD|nr:hypothetical protein SEA_VALENTINIPUFF_112 [Microbacterium phage ValentiniPuff]